MVFLNCDLCDFSAADKNLMDRHMMKHTGRVIFTCHSCEFEATKQALLENHIEKIHGNNKPWWYEAEATNHQCERCEETFKHIFVKRHHNCIPKSKYPCPKCDFMAITMHELLTHMEDLHVSSKAIHNLKCDRCDYKYNTNEQIRSHIQIKHETPKVDIDPKEQIVLQCDQCDFKCHLNIQLNKHKKAIHKPEDLKYKCTFCAFQSDYLIKMYEHKLEDHPDDPIDSNPKRTNVIDMILNLLAEQNMDIIEEMQDLKKSFRGAFVEMSDVFKETMEDTTNSAFSKINQKLSKLEKIISSIPDKPRTSSLPKQTESSSPSLSPLPSSRTKQAPPQKSDNLKKKTSPYLQKPKVLIIGDSVANNANFGFIERQTNTRVKTVKAYSSNCDIKARWPQKNVTDVTPSALDACHEDDKFSHLILGAPTVDITNLDTSKLTELDNIEVYKQKAIVSSQNIFTVAKHALERHPNLEKIVILEHNPRFDVAVADPTGLKPKLAKFANAKLAQLVNSSVLKDKLVIGKHNLDCSGERINGMYTDNRNGRFDGVHLYGREGYRAFTSSLLNIIKSVLPTPTKTASPSSTPFSHDTCPQSQYQKKQQQYTNSGHRSVGPIYSVPAVISLICWETARLYRELLSKCK